MVDFPAFLISIQLLRSLCTVYHGIVSSRYVVCGLELQAQTLPKLGLDCSLLFVHKINNTLVRHAIQLPSPGSTSSSI